MNILNERYTLAKKRISELPEQEWNEFRDYIENSCRQFHTVCEVYETLYEEEKKPSGEVLTDWNERLHGETAKDRYEQSFLNPALCQKQFGVCTGSYLCWYYTRIRQAIPAAYEGDFEEIVIQMELFLQMVQALSEEGKERDHSLKETMYYEVHDYEEKRIEKDVRKLLLTSESAYYMDIITNSDFSDTDYLCRYGMYVGENERKMAAYLAAMPEGTLSRMAHTYTEGYRKGFEIAGIDLSAKKTVQLRYSIGFEPMMRQAVIQFREMGLEPLIRRSCISTTAPDRQFAYDHRFDDALYLNRAFVRSRLDYYEKYLEKYREEAAVYAGPAVVEIFGEELFVPQTKKESPSYSKEQEALSVEYRRDRVLVQNRFIPQEETSFTIIAYPVPEIGEQFEAIFDATVQVNTLDMELYQKIQQALIDALDQGEYVHVTGRGDNHTDIRIALHHLEDPSAQTNFENCLADVNIPVGEVFTSPLLTGTEGTLHVTQVYLNGLRYENLTFTFEDGMVKDYNCSNYEKAEDNRRYIKENVLYNHDTLPIGEFAIGTNTTAYEMGRKFGIEAKLPILIAEKTGPHFALGDTCYSMSEEIELHNPDGKEIIAKENECSALRREDMSKAYFNCHTDITIPYDELGDIVVHTHSGDEIVLIRKGRFVLAGTEKLNEVLQ